MDRQDIQKLLGGYATGTLTPEEEQALFAAALDDQELFDALAREQSLRDVLTDPAARAQLLASIEDRPLPWYQRFWRPLVIATAAAACLISFGVYVNRPKPQPASSPVLVAELKQSEPKPLPQDALPQPPEPAPPAAPVNRPVRRDGVLVDQKRAVKSPSFAPAPPPLPVPAAAPAAPAAGAAAEPIKEMAKKAEIPVAGSAQGGLISGADLKDTAALGGVAGFQSGFRDVNQSKPISLQNAQALFYSSPQSAQSLDSVALAEQSPAPRQEQQQKTKQQKQQQAADTLRTISGLAAMRLAQTPLGVRWTILRQRDGGEFVEVGGDQLRTGDSVKLRLIPNAAGYLTIWEDSAVLLPATRVEQLMPVETRVITADRPVLKVVRVQLVRNAPAESALVQNAIEQQSATDARDKSTYVLNTNTSPAAPVKVLIPLTFK